MLLNLLLVFLLVLPFLLLRLQGHLVVDFHLFAFNNRQSRRLNATGSRKRLLRDYCCCWPLLGSRRWGCAGWLRALNHLCFGLLVNGFFLFELFLLLHASYLPFLPLYQSPDLRIQLLQLLDVVGVIFLVARPIIMFDCCLIPTEWLSYRTEGEVTYRVQLHQVRKHANLLFVVFCLADTVHFNFYFQVDDLPMEVLGQLTRFVFDRALRSHAAIAFLFDWACRLFVRCGHPVLGAEIQRVDRRLQLL